MLEQDFNRHNLRKFLVDNFSEDDIRDICFNLSVDYESLLGHGKANKARELIIFCEHRELFEELKRNVHNARSKDMIQKYLAIESEEALNEIKFSINEAVSFESVAKTIDLLFINQDEGVFELEETWISMFGKVTKITGNLTDSIRIYRQELTKLEREIDSLKNSKKHPSKDDFKGLYSKQAAILDDFAEKLSRESRSFEEYFSLGLLAFLRESTIHIIDFETHGKNRVEFMVLKLRELILSSESALYSDQMMMSSIKSIPRTISPLVKAKRKTLTVLEQQVSARKRILEQMVSIEALLNQMLNESTL